MKKYKLTNQDMQTHGGYQWELNVQKTTDGLFPHLCFSSWLHYYHSPLLAVILNPIHASVHNPRLFEVKALGKHLDNDGLKGGCTKMILIKEIELPVISINQKIAFGILCALEVEEDKNFIKWANNWLNGIDRTKEYAEYAEYAEYVKWAAHASTKKLDLIKLAEKAMTYS